MLRDGDAAETETGTEGKQPENAWTLTHAKTTEDRLFFERHRSSSLPSPQLAPRSTVRRSARSAEAAHLLPRVF
jgi:hypothetical protein